MIEELKKKFKEDLQKVRDKKSLEDLRVRYLGRHGELNKILSGLKELSEEERARVGLVVNEFKNEIGGLMKTAENKLKEAVKNFSKEWLDVTAPGLKLPRGHLHPRTIVLRKVEEIFQSLGFSVVEGPEMETDYYNFEALNVPKDHPARDMQDTFYITDELLMRTQTSPNQVRYMEKHNPPLRTIVPGRCFRRDATDASHEFQFYQVEGLMVDKHISVGNFKAVISEFFKRFFGQEVKTRLRPSYFPFTEPSFELDIQCLICGGNGCAVCKKTGWLEVVPGGMVHPKVFKSAGYSPYEWQGYAFGMGLDRMVMMKYKINDIRLLNFGDLRFLKQF